LATSGALSISSGVSAAVTMASPLPMARVSAAPVFSQQPPWLA
jgi:hypothetical protein